MELQHLRERIDLLNKEMQHLRERIEAGGPHSRAEFLRHEFANAVTHGIGVIFFLVAIPVLMACCVHYSSMPYTICAGIFCFGLLVTYLSSTLYHSFHNAEAKRLLRIFDHVSIFLLIGASYTPVVYYYLPHDFAIKFLIVFWLLIIVGCLFKVRYTGRFRVVSTFLYVAISFTALFIFKPLTAHMPPLIEGMLIASGLSYLFGVPFYIFKRLKYNHAIWHVFVLGGSVLHYFVVLQTVL